VLDRHLQRLAVEHLCSIGIFLEGAGGAGLWVVGVGVGHLCSLVQDANVLGLLMLWARLSESGSASGSGSAPAAALPACYRRGCWG
jgi:hypothetical protein